MKSLQLLVVFFLIAISIAETSSVQAQCFVNCTSQTTDTLTFSATGCSVGSYGCSTFANSFWLSGAGQTVTVNFVQPQFHPSIRVWGMNDDDSALISVNGNAYPLNSGTASYNPKVVCGVSPGPDGILFYNGNFFGANTNLDGNYSYQNITINSTGVNTVTVTGISGAGWGIFGASVNCSAGEGIHDFDNSAFTIYPNPVSSLLTIKNEQGLPVLVSISDVTGRELLQQTFNQQAFNANLSSYADGLYFINLKSENKTVTHKIAVQH